jgi:hypothetical protein
VGPEKASPSDHCRCTSKPAERTWVCPPEQGIRITDYPKALQAKDYSENPQTLGGHLKKRRRELGLLQREAAEVMKSFTNSSLNFQQPTLSPLQRLMF